MAPLQLANLRIASPCQERWADMVGDDRARLCAGCDRTVFDLSEMTRAEAEALLATRGITPCVRFYRRTDGTVMTADCPTGAVRTRRKLAVVAGAVAAGTSLFGASPAMAEPPEPAPEPAPDPVGYHFDHGLPVMGIPVSYPEYVVDEPHPTVEWSTWFRLGFGTEAAAPTGVARATTPATDDRHPAWEAALGADFSVELALHGDLRLGGWAEVRTSSGPVLGAELLLERHGILALRAGGNAHDVTAAIAYGYLAPWSRYGPRDEHTGYMTGVRFVASATRALDDGRDWSATVGLEIEPLGALRHLLGIRSR